MAAAVSQAYVPPPICLEKLLTHPAGFGLTTATPVQRAICRVAAGRPLGDVACDPNVVRGFGGPEAVEALGAFVGTTPLELYLLAAIRCGKSLVAACIGVWCGLNADLSILGPHEIARVPIVSLDKDKAEIILEHLRGAVARPFLGRRLVGDFPSSSEATKGARFRRDDGRIFEVKVVAGKKAGGSLVARWCAAVIFDECARMNGAEDGVVNLSDSRQAVLGRIRPRGMLVAPSSPWAPRGPVYETVTKYWGKPTRERVVIRATGPEMAPMIWTPEACEKLRLGDEGSYRTDVLGEFADPETSFFADSEVRAVERAEPLHRTKARGVSYAAAMDTATRGNAWTLVVVGREDAPSGEDSEARYHVAYHRQWQGTKLEPLIAKVVFGEIRSDLATYGLSEAHTDQYGGDLIKQIGDDAGVEVCVEPWTQEEMALRGTDLKNLVTAKRIELPPDPEFRADVLATKKTLTPNGFRLTWPVTKDARHADYGPALVRAVHAARSVPGWIGQFAAWAERGMAS